MMTHPDKAPRVLVLASGKGGVGKSTVALALAAELAARGPAVALVDADPQGGVTRAAGVAVPTWDTVTADPVTVHGLTLWPAGRALAGADVATHAARLEAARQGVGWVVVDCSPALTDAAHAATFAAASLVLVVARCDAAGLPSVAETVELAHATGRPARIVPTFHGPTGLAREALAFLRGRYGDAVTETTFPTDARAAEAPGRGLPVTHSAPRSRVAVAVRALVDELEGGNE
jgi:chromosome partitioning protein